MKRHCRRGACPARGQRGFALVAILSLIALMSAYLIANAFGRSSAELSNARERRSMDALRQAKAALIAYAASEQWQLYKVLPKVPPDPAAYFQPGALPCPDQDDDGDADCFGSNTASMIGRVPFKTLGIDDLRDASGERLWYALSHDFRKMQCPGTGCTTINSDTLGQLTVTGIAPATQVVAIVFAPGEAIQGQNRDPTNAGVHNNPLNYLEGPPDLSNPVNYIFTTAQPSGTFNDRLLVITQAELMAAVEPVVAARIERDIKPILDKYRNLWGRHPFAARFDNPDPGSSNIYQGGLGNLSGLLPLKGVVDAPPPTFVQWVSSPAPTVVPVSGAYNFGSCTIASSLLRCDLNYSGSVTVDITGTALNAGLAYLRVHTNAITEIMVSNNSTCTTFAGCLSTSISPQPSIVAPNNSLLSAPPGDIGKGRVTLRLSLPSNAVALKRVLIAPPQYDAPVAAAFDWFKFNQWYRQVYYAIAPAFAPGGSGDCAANPPCLTVNSPRPVAAASCTPLFPATDPCLPNNKEAILIFAGRALNGTGRPSATLANYLEGANSTGSVTNIYEHRAGVPTSINDRVVVVWP